MNPEISIVVPLYNAEKYIETCIDSIRSQTFKDFELIIIDDKSTDRSLEIVRNYRDPRIKIYQQIKNSGESSSRNFGLTVSTGKYVYFMDDDDAILKNTLEIFYNEIEETNSDVVYMSRFYRALDLDFKMSDKLRVQEMYGDNEARFLPADMIQRLQDNYIDGFILVEPWIKIQKRKFLIDNEIYFPNVTRGGDLLFNIAELTFADHARVIDACCYVYRSHEQNTMNADSVKSIRQAVHSMPGVLEYLRGIFLKSQMPVELQMKIEIRVINELFLTFIMPSYAGKLSLERTNEVIGESLDNIPSKELSRVLFNMLACKFE